MAMHNINNDSVLPNGKATTANPRQPIAIRFIINLQKFDKAKQAADNRICSFSISFYVVYKQGTVFYSPFTEKFRG
jgi:hypothetical protein